MMQPAQIESPWSWRDLVGRVLFRRVKHGSAIHGRGVIGWWVLGWLTMCGCSSPSLSTDPQAARRVLEDTLQAWQQGKQPDELKSLSAPIYVGDLRWEKGAKLIEFSIASEGEYHQSSVRFNVRMRVAGEPKASEKVYWVSTNPANTVTLAD
ncbi:MAG: hypothetical protein IT423_19825 [Pirellulaceae bacterium]|nr:hypothetical protein [Pirellulaceae bacterium]